MPPYISWSRSCAPTIPPHRRGTDYHEATRLGVPRTSSDVPAFPGNDLASAASMAHKLMATLRGDMAQYGLHNSATSNTNVRTLGTELQPVVFARMML